MPRHFSELKSGGGQFLCCPLTLKSEGRIPPVPHRSSPAGGAEAGRGFSAPQINFVQENIIMELATFKRSVLTQSICLYVCTYVCLLGFCLFVYLFFVCL